MCDTEALHHLPPSDNADSPGIGLQYCCETQPLTNVATQRM